MSLALQFLAFYVLCGVLTATVVVRQAKRLPAWHDDELFTVIASIVAWPVIVAFAVLVYVVGALVRLVRYLAGIPRRAA